MKRVKIPLGLANVKFNHTVEGWRCKECGIFYAKKELKDRVCWYCTEVVEANKALKDGTWGEKFSK